MNYLIAAHHKWNQEQFERINQKRKANLFFISKKQDLSLEYLENLNPKYIFFPHWSYKVPSEILEKFTCVCFHMTDLPYGRGGSPLQNLIIRGHKKTKISALRMVEDFDAGPIYMKRNLSLTGKAEIIYKRASKIIFSMIEEIIKKEPKPKDQKGKVTKFDRRKRTQSDIKGLQSLDEIFDHIRMLDAPSYPKAFLEVDNFVVEFTNVRKRDGHFHAEASFKIKEINED